MNKIFKKTTKSILLISILLFLITCNAYVISAPININEPGYSYVNGVKVRDWPVDYQPLSDIEINEAIELISKYRISAAENPNIKRETYFSETEKILISKYQEYHRLRYIAEPAEYSLVEPTLNK